MNQLSVTVGNERTGAMVCGQGRIAATFFSRLAGLLGEREFEAGDGLLIRPCFAVHTIGMAFAIDVIGLDKNGRVVSVRPNLKPRSVAFLGMHSRDVLELPAGQIERSAVHLGDTLVIELNSNARFSH